MKNIIFSPIIDNSLNEIFDENVGNSFLAIRKLKWNEESPYRIDMRKWYTNSEGEEIAGKGVSFLTEEGPSELTKILIKHGYGNTEEILDQLSEREDFASSLNRMITKKGIECIEFLSNNKDTSNQEFYDPKELI